MGKLDTVVVIWYHGEGWGNISLLMRKYFWSFYMYVYVYFICKSVNNLYNTTQEYILYNVIQ